MKDSIDEFESMFKAAQRQPFTYQDISFPKVALITDGSTEGAKKLREALEGFLPQLKGAEWAWAVGDDYSTVAELLEWLKQHPVDLVITYRHLQEKSLVPQHSLGVYLDVLTQVTNTPVLVLPGTAAEPVPLEGRSAHRLMVVTDHISGDDMLINNAMAFADKGDEVWLCHVEDDVTFNRYMGAIEKIPGIDTDQARQLLGDQLVKGALDFIHTASQELKEHRPEVTVYSGVKQGHTLPLYVHLVKDHQIDLVVVNTKHEGQLAMHGMAYSLSVELIDVPLLLL